jgi:hypothetical protein
MNGNECLTHRGDRLSRIAPIPMLSPPRSGTCQSCSQARAHGGAVDRAMVVMVCYDDGNGKACDHIIQCVEMRKRAWWRDEEEGLVSANVPYISTKSIKSPESVEKWRARSNSIEGGIVRVVV